MSTSANTINYSIFKDGKEVGSHSQNIMCKRCNDKLVKFQPASDFTIRAWGYDEDEEMWEGEKEYNLADWLTKNPQEITFEKAEVGDTIRLNKKRGEVKVLEVLKGRLFPEYLVELNNEKVTVLQTEIIEKVPL